MKRSATAAAKPSRGDQGPGGRGGGERTPPSAGRGGRGDSGRGRGADGGGRSGGPSPPAGRGGRGDHGQSHTEADGGVPAPKDSPKSSSSPTPPPPPPTPPPVLGEPPGDSYAAKAAVPKEELAAHRFYQYLEMAKLDSKKEPYYRAQVKSMKAKEIFKLHVNFNDLKAYDRKFSHYVCNNKERLWDWLLSAVRKFLHRHYSKPGELSGDDAINLSNSILLDTELSFSEMPLSIESLLQFIQKNKDALSEFLDICFETGKSVLVSTDLGSHIFYSCVRFLIHNHILGHSWNGEFSLEDWDVINGSQIVLSKRPDKNFSIGFGAKDLSHLDKLLIRLYQKKGKDGVEATPLFFTELDYDLTVTASTLTAEDLDWYREYMLSHPAFKTAMARIDLIRGLYREVKTHNLSHNSPVMDILASPNESWVADWRVIITSTKSYALTEVYWHGIPEEARKTATPNYDKSLGSCLDLNRNSCEHLEEKTRDKWGKQLMMRSIEAEVFTASKVEKFLTNLLRKLLKKCNMGGPFADVWHVYKSSGLNLKVTPKTKK